MRVSFPLLVVCIFVAGCDHFEVRSERVDHREKSVQLYAKLQAKGWAKCAGAAGDTETACGWKEFPMECRALFLFPFTCKKSVTLTISESQDDEKHLHYRVSTLGRSRAVEQVADRASAEIKEILGD